MSPINLLIAEPSKTGRHIFSQLVSRLGVNVTFTTTAHETLMEAGKNKYQMVCLSQKLPDDEGVNVCAKLRKFEQYAAVTVLLVMPQKSSLDYDHAFTSGVTQLIGRHELHRFVHAVELMLERAKPIVGNVLVVEDSRSQAEYVSALLKSMGLEVSVVCSAEQAIGLLAENTFSLALIDVVLAGTMTGVELVDYIRALPEPRNRLRILAMSAYEDSSRRIKLFNLGVDDFILKPLVREELIARVRGLLSQHHIVATTNENERLSRSLRQLLDNSPDVIARFNLDGELMFMNPRMEQELGVEQQQMLGKHYSELGLPLHMLDIYQLAISELIKSQQVVRYQVRGNNDVEFDLQFSPEIEEGAIVSFISSARDITNIKKLQQQLMTSKQAVEMASEAKSRFLATMSHELRTPLNAICGFTQLLKTKLFENDVDLKAFAQYLNHIGENADNLTNLIDDVLDLSRIEAGKLKSHLHSVDMHEMFDAIKAGFSAACDARKIRLNVFFEHLDSESVVLDKPKTLTILNNLIDNAVKFSHVAGEVRVVVVQQDDYLTVEIIDQGIGIPESFADKLFSPFEQVDNSRTRDYGGTGLGLTIVSKFTEFLGGTIEISSVENSGTTCVLRLPIGEAGSVEQEDEEKNPPCVEKVAEGVRFDGQKVLVVEDSVVNQQLMQACLGNLGLRVLLAEDGIAGVEKYVAEQPDLVLMDMHMPRMDGLEATSRIRRIESDKRTPVFGLSADVHTDYIHKAFDSGIDEYLTKPVDFSVLVGLMTQYFKGSASEASDVSTQQSANGGMSMSEQKVLNVDKGILFAANNSGLYRQLLQTFVSQYHQSDVQLQGLFTEGKYDEAMKLSHTMKGVSSTLGMDPLSEVAKTMQFAFANVELDNIESLLEQYAQLLSYAVDEAKAYCAEG